MTQKEMTEIFGIMLLAYPNAEIFKGGIQKLAPTISLWCECLPDVDFWIAQQAVIKLCRECKFPPTIAEFKEKSDAVRNDIQSQIADRWNRLKLEINFGKTPEEVFEHLPNDCIERAAIELIGGPSQLIIKKTHRFADGHTEDVEKWNRDGFCAACEKMIRREIPLDRVNSRPISTGPKQIGGRKN